MAQTAKIESKEKSPFQRIVSVKGRNSFNLDIISTTVENGEVVMDNAHPLEIARATKVGSAGKAGSAPKMLPKKTAIMIGLTPR